MPTPEDLAARIREHCAGKGVFPTNFGKAVANDPNLVRDLERGRDIGLKMMNKIEAALAQ